MPYPVPSDFTAVLRESHAKAFRFDASYGITATFEDLPVAAAGSMTTRADARIQTTGRIYIKQAEDRAGRRLLPTAMRDALAPFGQTIDISLLGALGSLDSGLGAAAISLGRYRITEIPSAAATARRVGALRVPDAIEVEVAFADQFEAIDQDDFTAITAPATGGSALSEIRRLSPLPVAVSSITDAKVPASVVYKENRLDAILDLCTAIDAVPYIDRQGVLQLRPADPFAISSAIDVDLTGAIQDQSNGMSSNLKNVVVVRSYDAGASQVLASASITDGPLSIYGPFGRRVLNYSSPFVTTAAAGRKAAAKLLRDASTGQAKNVVVNCLPDPRLAPGDKVKATDPQTNRVEIGLANEIEWSFDPTELMKVTILVPQAVIPWA